MTVLLHKMNAHASSEKINFIIRIFLFILIFWLPYSNAVIESCVIVSVVLWIIKRGFLFFIHIRQRRFHPGMMIQSFRPTPTILDRPIAVFLFIAVVSSIFGSDPGISLRAFVTKTLEWFAVFYLVAETITEKRHRHIFLGIFILTSAATALDSLFQFYVTGKDIFFSQPLTRQGATAAFNHANGLGAYWTIAIPLTCGLIFYAGSKKVKKLLGIVLALMIWSLVVTFSRGAWLAVAFGILIFVFYRNKRVCFYLALGLVGLGLLFPILCPRESLVKSRLNMGSLTRTISWRLGIWEDSMKMIRLRPLIGYGVNTYMRLFQHYRRKAWEGPLYEGKYTPQPYSPTYAHNCFVQLTAELGLLGLITFSWIVFRFIWNFVKIIPSFLTRDKQTAVLWIGLFSGLMAYLIHCFLDTDLYSLKLSAYFWFISGMTVTELTLNKR